MRRHKDRNRRLDRSLNGNAVWIEAEAKTTSSRERSDEKRESDRLITHSQFTWEQNLRLKHRIQVSSRSPKKMTGREHVGGLIATSISNKGPRPCS